MKTYFPPFSRYNCLIKMGKYLLLVLVFSLVLDWPGNDSFSLCDSLCMFHGEVCSTLDFMFCYHACIKTNPMETSTCDRSG